MRDAAPPVCTRGDSATASGNIDGSSSSLHGGGKLAKAALSVRPQAFTRTDELAVPPFPAQIDCQENDLSGDPAFAEILEALVREGFLARTPHGAFCRPR